MTKLEREHDDIQMGLNCPLADCVDCQSPKNHKERTHVARAIKVRELSKLRLTDAEIANRIGCHKQTVCDIRKKLGIPNYRKRAYGTGVA